MSDLATDLSEDLEESAPVTEQAIQLTLQQKSALHKIVKGIREEKRDEISLGGFAGTGKTTIVKYLVKFFPGFGVAAYTGKAANVLRKKSISGTTIHSRIYKPYFDNGVVYFDLTDSLDCDGFIIDEASMVSSEIYSDLKSFNRPCIFVGDHGQLMPIGTDFNLMAKPDVTLEEIHRNAGPIAMFAEHLRKGYVSKAFRGNDDEKVRFTSKKNITINDLLSVDQIICAYNKTRCEVNSRIRKANQMQDLVHVGERVMCLRNNKQFGLFNGMQGTVVNLYNGKNKRKLMDFEFDGQIIEGIWYDPKTFGTEKPEIRHGRDEPNPFDYAYCITAHKSQGDEWNNVMVYEQKCKNWEHRRWAYTAASRAKQKLHWVLEY